MSNTPTMSLSKIAHAVTGIQEFLRSNCSWDTHCPYRVSGSAHHSLQASVWTVCEIWKWKLSSTCSAIHYLLVIPSFDVIQYELVPETLNQQKTKKKNLVFLSVSGFSFPSYLVNSTPCTFCQIILYIIHWHQTGISGEYYETTGTLHNLRLCHEGIRSHSVVSNTVQTSIVLNWEYQHPTVLKLMRVTPAERMEVCIKFEIFMWQNLWQAVI